MKKILIVAVSFVMISGCASPRFTSEKVVSTAHAGKDFVIVKDEKTREGFLSAVADWLKDNGHSYTIVGDGVSHDLEKVTIEYVGFWKWDLALFLSEAKIEAFHEGQRIGEVDYRAPNTLSAVKFGEARDRIFYMMDVLFGKITPQEAAKEIKKSKSNQ